MAVTCVMTCNVHMLGMALIICIIHAVTSLTVNTDRPARVLQSAHIRIARPLYGKAFTAGIILAVRMLSSYHDVAFTAALVFVVYTVFHAAV